MTMTISEQQDDHHEHYDHDQDQHQNNQSNTNDIEYSLEKNKDCTPTINTTTNTRVEGILHGKKMIQSRSSSIGRSLPPHFEIPKTLMSNDSIDNDNNNNINDSEKSMKFLRGLYSTFPGIEKKRQRRNTKRATTCTTTSSCDDDDDDDHKTLNDPKDITSTTSMAVITGILEEIDRDKSNKINTSMEEDCDYDNDNEDDVGSDDDDDDDEEEIMIVPIQYDNYVNKRQMLSTDITSIAGKRRNELLLDDESSMYDAVQAMKLEFELLSSGNVSSGDEEEDDDDDDDDDDDNDL